MAAGPFGGGPSDRKSEDPRGSRESQMFAREIGSEQRDAGVEREYCRQPNSRNRHQPPESSDIDKEGAGNPVKARNEKAETEDIAEAE